MNIVYGGAFNPPTLAHYEIVNSLIKNFQPNKIIMIPVGNHYNKSELVDFEHRKAMLKQMFNDDTVIISNIEDEKKFKGTLNSLKVLGKKYDDLHLVIGSDNIEHFDEWINYETLLKKYPLIIMQRHNDDVHKLMSKYQHLNPKYEIVKFSHEASSTNIRKNFAANSQWLHPDVKDYIIKNNLYGVNKHV